jgi:hypothetical protein
LGEVNGMNCETAPLPDNIEEITALLQTNTK